MAHPGGAPTKFDPSYTEKLINFFTVEPYRQVVSESTTESFKDGGIKKESVKYRLIPNKLPTLFGFARSIKVAYSTVWRWSEKGGSVELQNKIDKSIAEGKADVEDLKELFGLQEFCNAYKEAKELQKEFIIGLGLAGAAPAPFAIFTAKNITDMRDKQEIDHSSLGEPIKGFNYLVPNEANNNTNNQTT